MVDCKKRLTLYENDNMTLQMLHTKNMEKLQKLQIELERVTEEMINCKHDCTLIYNHILVCSDPALIKAAERIINKHGKLLNS